MNDNVVVADIPTTLDLPTERILQAAIDANLDRVLVLGFTKEGDMYAAASFADAAVMVYLMERFKHELLAGDYA